MDLSGRLGRFLFDAASACLLFVVAISGGYLPRYFSLQSAESNGNTRSLVFQLGNMLSAGVMLSAALCHLLADAIPATEKAVRHFPLAPFLCACGYLLTLTADQYAKRSSPRIHRYADSPTLLKSNHESSDSLELSNNVSATKNGVSTAIPSAEGSYHSDNALSMEMDEMENETEHVSFLTALVLGIALSLHSVLEGLALGAQQKIEATLRILVAIAAHKGLAAYALGASLVDSKTTTQRFWRVLMGFSIASPIGILIGFALSEVSNNAGAASLSALASGTFLYIATMEVIPNELKYPENSATKIAIMFLGFGTMSVLAIWA